METCDAPDCIEVSNFHFSQLRTLRLVKGNEKVCGNSINVVAGASKYGLLFVGIEKGFKILKFENILDLSENREIKSIEENYYCQIVVSASPTWISLSSDQKTLSVCVNRKNSAMVDMYDIAAFANPEGKPTPFLNVQLSTNGSQLKDFAWNPAITDMYAFCMSDGSISVHELSGVTLKIIANLSSVSATAVCWSPKGKQIVVGKFDGSFSQYKPTLQEVKSVPPPAVEEQVSVSNICWVSTTQFVVLYAPIEKGLSPYLFVVTTPKGAAINYKNFYDICLGNSSEVEQRYFLHFEPSWGTVVCGSSDSIEIAVIGDSPNWIQWDVREDGKAILPGKDGATHSIGMGVMYCVQRRIIISEVESYPPMPVICFLTNNGLLVSYHMVNSTPDLQSLVYPSIPIDTQGERKKPGGGQKLNFTPEMPKLQPPGPVTSSIDYPTSIFKPQLLAQENKTNLFSSSTQSTFGSKPFFGLNQTNIETQNGPSMSGLTPVSIVPAVPSTVISHPPVKIVSTLSVPMQDQLKTSLSNSSSVNNVSKQAAFSDSPITGNLVPKEELKKQNTFMTAIIEEIQSFEKELLDLKSNSVCFSAIGTKEEMATLQTSTLSAQEFKNEMSHTMASLNSKIHDSKNVLLESFAMVEDANSRERRKNDHTYLSLLKEKALDPIRAKQMKEIDQHYLYLNTQLQEVNNKIDQDWFEYLKKKKANQKSVSQLSSAESIYQILVNNQNIIHNARKHLDYIKEKATAKRLENISLKKRRPQYMNRSAQEELSKLADSFLTVKVSKEEDKSSKIKKIPLETQNVLKNYFSSAKINTVRPTVVNSPSQSRLISRSVLHCENIKKQSHTIKANTENSRATTPLLSKEPSKVINNTFVGHEKSQVFKSKDLESAAVPRFTLPSVQTPSPRESSSPSVSSSGGPLYEDITPPGSPESTRFSLPETLSFLQELISQGNYDEEKLSAILEAAMKYNNGNFNFEIMSPAPMASKEVHQTEISPSQHFSQVRNSPNLDITFQPFSAVSISNSNVKSQPPISNLISQSVLISEPIKKDGDYNLSRVNVNAAEKSTGLFSFSPSTSFGLKTNESAKENKFSFGSMQKSNINYVTPTSNVAQGRNVISSLSDKAKIDPPPNQNLASSASFFSSQNKPSSLFVPPNNSALNLNKSKITESNSHTIGVVKPPVSSCLNTSSILAEPNKPVQVSSVLTFGGLPSLQPASVQSKKFSFVNTPDTSVTSVESNKQTVNLPSMLFQTTTASKTTVSSSFSFAAQSESKTTSSSSVGSEAELLESEENSVSGKSTLTSQLTTSKPNTVSFVPSMSTAAIINSTSADSKPLNSGSTLLSQVLASEEKNPISLLLPPSTVPDTKIIEVSLSDISKTVANSSIADTLTITNVTASTSSLSQPSSIVKPVISSGSIVAESPVASLNSPALNTSNLQSTEGKPETVSTSSKPDASNVISSSFFGSQVTSSNSLAENPPSSTASSLFGQNVNEKSFFATPSTTQSFFGATNSTQPSFFNKSAFESTTTKPSLFGNTSSDAVTTTSSFFGKTQTDTPGFGQSTFAQGSVFGASATTQGTGSFFSQSPGGASSLFGTSTVKTSESTGFGVQSGGSFTFAKSSFGQTEGSFGLAKSVFGQSSTFGQPASPQTNTGFGSSFSQGFGGLGRQPTEENASKNVFAMGNIGKQSSESNTFGNTGASAFGAKTNAFVSGSFSSGGGSVAQSGFGAFQQSPQKSGGFGASPSFGGSPGFGSASAFGSPPSFGSGNALSSVFGGSTQQPASFSSFASANSPTFGSLASQPQSFGSPQPQGFGSQPVFGGGTSFGSQAPSFGSPSSSQSNSSSAFTQWRN